MPTETDFTKKLIEFIDGATEIGKMCSDEYVHRSNDEFLAVEVHNKYVLWKDEVWDYLRNEKGMIVDAKLFFVENSVPWIKGGLEYSYKDSRESRALIKAISIELDEKLKHIRELWGREQDGRPSSSIVTICLGSGAIWREQREERRYDAKGGKALWVELIRLLYTKRRFMLFREIQENIGYKSIGALSSSVKKTNRQAMKKLDLSENLIEHEDRKGYRIDPQYEIKPASPKKTQHP